jgi:catechol 2,3-dioxygenase-like lactoylglutathione lyase family enzyme
MPRGLDHIVHAVRELEVAADFYRRLGLHATLVFEASP